VGNLTGKHVAGSLGGVAATIAVPNAIRPRGWSDAMSSSSARSLMQNSPARASSETTA